MNETNARKKLVEYCRKLYDKGYVPGIDGNISMRLGRESILITPSGVSKEVVMPSELVRISLAGQTQDEHKKPSIETPMHLAAYNNSDASAVFHVHSPNVTAFALAQKNIDTRLAPFAYYHLGEIGYVPYYSPGSKLLHAEVTQRIKNNHIVLLLESHGAMVLGAGLSDAFVKTDLLENFADMIIKASSIGGAQRLTDEQISELHGG